MKRILSVVFLLFIGLSTQAQDAKKAKELLDEVSVKVKSYTNIVIDFKYAINNPAERINQESNGNVALQGNLYHLNFMGISKIFDGKKIAFLDKGRNEKKALTREKNKVFKPLKSMHQRYSDL